MSRRWLLLNSSRFLPTVSEVVVAGGDVFATPGSDWSPWKGLAPETPDVVCADHDCGKCSVLVAGFYRGYGLPVVWIGKPIARSHRTADKLARLLGFYVVDDPGKVCDLFRPGNPYLRGRPPGRDLTPEVIAAYLSAHAGKSGD